MKHLFLIFLLVLTLMLIGCFDPSSETLQTTPGNTYNLTILHTNDTHGGYGGLDDKNRICYQSICAGGAGGLIRLGQAVEAIRRESPSSTILLDAGDQFQGTLFFNLYKEDIPAFALNVLNYDAMCPGNHEFDDGCGRFTALIQKMHPPMLAANLNLPGNYVKPWVILERNNRKIGIIGIALPGTPELSSPCTEALFSDPLPALQKAVNELTAQGINIIIALEHLGLSNDLALAEKIDDIDIIVGGHSHSLLSNSEADAEGTYPMVKKSPSGHPVLVVTSGHGGTHLGRLNVRFNEQGIPVAWSGDSVPLNTTALTALNADEPNSTIYNALNAWADGINDVLKKPLGTLITPGRQPGLFEADARLCREMECLSANIVTDAIKAHTGAEVALINGGSIRSPLSSGMVNIGEILTMLPFNNTLWVGTVPGKTLWAALEHGLSGFENKEGRFPQVAGLRYIFDAARPRGKRLISVEILNTNGHWDPINIRRSYRMVTLDYLARGGDGFIMLKNLDWKNTDEQVSDVVRKFIIQRSPLSVKLEKRITAR